MAGRIARIQWIVSTGIGGWNAPESVRDYHRNTHAVYPFHQGLSPRHVTVLNPLRHVRLEAIPVLQMVNGQKGIVPFLVETAQAPIVTYGFEKFLRKKSRIRNKRSLQWPSYQHERSTSNEW